MGSLLEFRRTGATPSPAAAQSSANASLAAEPLTASARRKAAWGLSTALVERKGSRGRKAVVYIEGLAIVCVVAEVPLVGDRIHGDIPAVVEKVRVTRDGHVRIYARPSAPPGETRPSVRPARAPSATQSARIAGVLAELRRRRMTRDQGAGHRELPDGA